MSDIIRLEQETKQLASLKQYLKDVLSLRPIEELSPLSVSVLRTAKVVTDEIGAWAGSLSFHKGIDTAYKDLLTAMKVNCTTDEVEVIELALDSFTWVSDELEGYPFSVAPYLNGDEVFWAWDFLFMTDEQIKNGDESDGENKLGKRRVILKRFADLGIDVLGLGEARKTESGGNASPSSKSEVFVGSVSEINARMERYRIKNLAKKWGVDLNAKRWRIELSVVIDAPDEQKARDEVAVLSFEDVERIKSITEIGKARK